MSLAMMPSGDLERIDGRAAAVELDRVPDDVERVGRLQLDRVAGFDDDLLAIEGPRSAALVVPADHGLAVEDLNVLRRGADLGVDGLTFVLVVLVIWRARLLGQLIRRQLAEVHASVGPRLQILFRRAALLAI